MIIHFNANEFSLITIAQHVLWIYKSTDGKMYILNGRCPHKGGPLYLGKNENQHIVCPWHETKVPLEKLIGSSYPAIFVGNRATLLFHDESNSPFSYRCLSKCISF